MMSNKGTEHTWVAVTTATRQAPGQACSMIPQALSGTLPAAAIFPSHTGLPALTSFMQMGQSPSYRILTCHLSPSGDWGSCAAFSLGSAGDTSHTAADTFSRYWGRHTLKGENESAISQLLLKPIADWHACWRRIHALQPPYYGPHRAILPSKSKDSLASPELELKGAPRS